MDDSSDFQEIKKSASGPKPLAKKTVNPKKALKKIKGQKDIRKVLKRKNNLESYSKEFDKVCKKAGIDVDPEQLQLAIALSKSLQTESNFEGESSRSKTSQERVGKIRSTLLEYGFKVPEIKITGSKKLKNYRKKYKLLQTVESEKQQIIANRYSQILLEDISNQSICENNDNSNTKLYHLATNASYDVLRTNTVFYTDLIEQSSNTGNLLREWSEIPGRPISPKIAESTIMNFSEIECSLDEVDTVLSGSLRSCQNIIKNKSKMVRMSNNQGKVEKLGFDKLSGVVAVEENAKSTSNSNQKSLQKVLNNNEIINLVDPIYGTTYRSCSPDIFDDELSVVDDSKNLLSQAKVQTFEDYHVSNTVNKSIDLASGIPRSFETILLVSSQHTNKTKRVSNDFMDITECVKIKDFNTINSQLSQKNVTKRKSNDFMEITSCISTTNQVHCDIDLTQIPQNNVTSGLSCVETNNFNPMKSYKKVRNETETHIDLTQNDTVTEFANGDKITNLEITQSSNSSDDLPAVSLTNSKTNSFNNTILVDFKEYDKLQNKSCDVLDLTDGVECVNPPDGRFFEEFVHNHSENNHGSYESLPDKIDLTQNLHRNEDLQNDIHLTQNSIISPKASTDLSTCPIKINDYKAIENIQDKADLTQEYNKSNYFAKISNENDIDLTQNSNSSNEIHYESHQKSLETTNVILENINDCLIKSSQRYSNLGKKDDISIDYDEVSEISNVINLTSSKNKFVSNEHNSNNNKDNINDLEVDLEVINDFDANYYSSQNSEAFQISDKELDYSLNKSKLEKSFENFQVGRVSSILEDLSKVGSFRKSATVTHESLIIADYGSDHEPTHNDPICYTNKEISPIRHKRINEISTPKNAGTSGTLVETPNNSQYVVKTNNVTPMPCYELMSTPEIHKELDKYGIKPFKRKRAIQLLSHIYNQTHPVIEYPDEGPSPAKKQKFNKSPKKRLTPKKLITSPKSFESNQNDIISQGKELQSNQNDQICQLIELDSKEIVYEVTNNPVLKEVDCNQEDWVFQKREKAKVHSCRVPLHIAFHNYVTSRQSLHEAILCYKPINIDVVHKDLVSYGHRYDPKELLKFLDKKCITVKTTDNDARNNKR